MWLCVQGCKSLTADGVASIGQCPAAIAGNLRGVNLSWVNSVDEACAKRLANTLATYQRTPSGSAAATPDSGSTALSAVQAFSDSLATDKRVVVCNYFGEEVYGEASEP